MTLPVELVPRFRGHSPAIPVYADPDAIEAGRFVKITGKNTAGAYIAEHCGAGDKASGVSERKVPAVDGRPTEHNSTNTCGPGAIARVVAGAAVAIDDLVSSDASGRAITYVAPDTTTVGEPIAVSPAVNGVALTEAAEAGDIIEVRLT